MPSNFKILSLHGNVTVGDAAIHLLVENDAVVRSAVLVDGGSNHNKSVYEATEAAPTFSSICRMIYWINFSGRFTFKDDVTEEPLECLKLTSIVLSHWDEDHHAGIHNAIFESWEEDNKQEPVSWIRWSQDNNNKTVPLTAFYCPNTIGNKAKGGNRLNGVAKAFEEHIVDGTHYIGAKFNERTNDFAEYFSAEADKWCVLGADFFSNNKLKNQVEGQWTVQLMMDDNPPRPSPVSDYQHGRPGMYGIGFNRRSLLKPPTGVLPQGSVKDTDPNETVKALDGLGTIPDEGVTMTNKVSIAVVCLWAPDDGGTVPRCTHYFAGDADDVSEGRWLDWLKGSGIDRITSMKLSHHGSRSSSPLLGWEENKSIFQRFTPLNVVVSTPTNKYFHPAWETLLHFSTCADVYSQTEAFKDRLPRFIATKAPYYFSKRTIFGSSQPQMLFADPAVGNRSNRFNTEAFDDSKQGQLIFQKFIQKGGDNFRNMTSANPFVSDFEKYKAAANPDKRKTLLETIEGKWRKYGWPPLDANNTQAAHLSNFPSAESSWETDFVSIVQHNSDQYDGLAAFKTVNGGSLIDIHPAKFEEPMQEEPVTDWFPEMSMLNPEFQSMSDDPPIGIDEEVDHGTYIFNILMQTGQLPQDAPIGEGSNPNEFLGDGDYWDWEYESDPEEEDVQTGNPSLPIDPGPVIPPDDDADPPPSTGYFMYPSTIKEERILAVKDYSQSAGHLHLTSLPSWDWFAQKLHTSVMRLTSKPTAEKTTIALHDNDELAHWMSLALQGATMELVSTLDEQGKFTFEEMALALPLKPRDKTNPYGVNFSTEPNNMAKVFGFGDVPAMNQAGMGNLGLRNSATVLMFALRTPPKQPATNTAGSFSVYDLASFAGFDSALKEYPWAALLQALTLAVPDATSPNVRNGIWFIPDMSYRTVVRLQMDLDQTAMDHIKDVLGVLGKSITMTKCTAIARRTCTWAPGLKKSKDYRAIVEPRLVLIAFFQLTPEFGFHTVIDFQKSHIQVTLTLDFKSSKAIDRICDWLAEVSGVESSNFQSFKDRFSRRPSVFSGVDWEFRRVTIDLAPQGSAGAALTAKPSLTFSHLKLDIEVSLKREKKAPIYFLISFSYTPTTKGKWTDAVALEGKLWLEPTFNAKEQKLLLAPDYENYKQLCTSDNTTLPTSLDLRDFDALSSLPAWVPTNIEQADLLLSKQQMAFSLVVKAAPPSGTEKVPMFQISEVDLSFAYLLENSKFSAAMAVTAILQPPDKTHNQFPVQLEGMVKYDDGNWTLSASVENLTGLYIAQFFDSGARDSVLSLLEHISIIEFDITYKYIKTDNSNFANSASALAVHGHLLIGEFDLNIDYAHKGSSDWCFSASATKADPGVSMTVGEIIKELTGAYPTSLPDFVSDISISLAGQHDGIGLAVMSSKAVVPPSKVATAANDEDSQLFFTAFFEIDGILTQYIQLRPYKASRKAETAGDAPSATKRLFVTALSALPSITVPLIGNITRVFDEALFLWVDHPKGIKKSELDTINSLLALEQIGKPPIPFKSAKKEVADGDVVLTPGLHFLLVLKDEKGNPKCVIDYQFKKDKKNATLSGTLALEAADEEPNQPSGMASYAKKDGPLSISNLGFSFANSTFSVMVDATVEIGPMEFQLVGFSLNMVLEGSFNLHNLPIPRPDLNGLAISYDKTPLQIAGLLNHYKTKEMDLYQGALAAGFKAWQFSAAGCYGTVKNPKKKPDKDDDDDDDDDVSYATAFLYCCLQGPLLSLPQAQITGINGGFGYNSHLRLPAVSEVLQFPLMTPNGQYSSPMDAQTAFFFSEPRWITPREDSFWIAAGLTAQAFKMLDIQAVIVVEWDPAVKLGLYGIASATVPFSAGQKVKFAFVQLALAATVDFAAGTMQIAAQLTPASFIIHPDCHLTGGFAMYSWFGDKADIPNGWVFTIGGYHSSFKAPPQYPVVPRLGISWNLGPVSIRGSAYFAITPAVCMGGGTWNVSMVAGPLSAYYAAYIDFLINFQPFYFIAEGGLSVGVKYSMDLWLVTIHISIDIAATIHLEGPPVHGVVHVNFWVFGFNVDFGDTGSGPPKPLSLDGFLSLVCKPDVPTKAVSEGPVVEVVDDASAFILSVEEGLVGSSDAKTPPNQPWTVRAATFAFSVTCKFAIYKANIVTPNPEVPTKPTTKTIYGPSTPINARPMCLDDKIFQSELTVTITEGKTQKRLVVAIDANPDPIWQNNKEIKKQLPAALWGPYDKYADPTKNTNNTQLLDGTRSDTSVDLLCGVRISRPDDTSCDKEALVPFEYVPFMISDVGDPRKAPVPEPVVSDFQPVEPDVPPRGPDGKPTRPSEQWSRVRKEWENPSMAPTKSASVGQDVVDTWQKIALDVMGWDAEKLKTKEPPLSGKQPKYLIGDLENRYIRAPMVTKAF